MITTARVPCALITYVRVWEKRNGNRSIVLPSTGKPVGYSVRQ